MKTKDFLTDYGIFILLKTAGPLVRILPPAVSFFIASRLGEIFFVLDYRHRAVVYANIKTALGEKLVPARIRRTVLDFYRAFAQDIFEVFYIPKFDRKYLEKYVAIEGLEHVKAGFQKGKGVIFAAVHAGGWELANIVCANLGLAFSMFVREQRLPHVEKVLDLYRSSRGCRFIRRGNALREVIRLLQANESVVMTVDQGGRSGTMVKFFDKYASMASGAIRLALKLDSALIPVFPSRIKGPRVKFFVEPVFDLESTGDIEKDVRSNLQRLVRIFEKHIAENPREYLWTYKIWKYSSEKSILILSDGKTGHLRSSQALAKIVKEHYLNQGITAAVHTAEVDFKSRLASRALTLAGCLSGKYICQGCLFCLKTFLKKESYLQLIKFKPEVIISCGSALVPVNYQLSRESKAKSLVIMKPSIFSTRRFDLVVMPGHDNPPRRDNVAVIAGALNLIDRDYLNDQAARLSAEAGLGPDAGVAGLGLLLGGDAKSFRLKGQTVKDVLDRLKSICARFRIPLLATTSRRTSREVEGIVKSELCGFEWAKLVVVANEKNYPAAVGGILGLSKIVVVSGESISMVCEAVSSLKHVVVFRSPGLPAKHAKFLENLSDKGRIRLTDAAGLGAAIERLLVDPPEIRPLEDNRIILEYLRRIL